MFPTISLSIERWKWNKQFEIYVSNRGHFRNREKKPIAPKVGSNGYLSIFVYGSKPGFRQAHRVVMLTWCPTIEAETLTVDHLDHNKRNNDVRNLEWVTEEENKRRAKQDQIALTDALLDRAAQANEIQPIMLVDDDQECRGVEAIAKYLQTHTTSVSNQTLSYITQRVCICVEKRKDAYCGYKLIYRRKEEEK